MIGTSIRGIRHLWRIADTSLTPILVKFREYGYNQCWVIRTKKEGHFGDSVVIFNNCLKNSFSYGISTYLGDDELKQYAQKVGYFQRTYTLVKENLRDSTNDMFEEIIMLPTTFEEDYSAFLKGNTKLLHALHDKYRFDENDIRTKRLYIYSDGSKNFFQWAMNAYYGIGMTMTTIKSILQWNDLYGQLSKNLVKGTITAYTTKSAIEALMAEMALLRKNKRMMDAINSFNTVQKKILKNNELSESDKETLSKFSKLSEVKRINFIKKVSSIDDFNELMRQMRHVCSVHFDWNKESLNDFLENVEGLNYKKVYENDNIVLVEVFDYDTIKQLGKATNWCISKNKSYWNNYVEHDKKNTHQYLIFDFSRREDDKLSIVGFTVKYNKGITNAHDFVNNNLMENNGRVHITLLNSYISKFVTSNNIYSILANDGIDINLVSNYDEPLYKWDKESVINYLYECVNQENTDILMSKGDKIAISVKDENVRYFFGDTYHDNISDENWGKQHIIFMDFSKSKYDINKLQFAIIQNNGMDEDYCEGIYNEHALRSSESFETKLIEFNLPYDIIRRTDNTYVKIRNAFYSFNTPMLKESVKNVSKKELIKLIEDYIGEEEFYGLLNVTVHDYMSLDYIDVLYSKDIMVSEAIGYRYASELCKNLINQILISGRQIDAKYNIPTDKEVEDFYEERIGNKHFAMYVGSYLFLNKLLDRERAVDEPYNSFAKKLIYQMRSLKGEMFNVLMLKIGEKMNFKRYDDAISYWLDFVAHNGNEEIIAFAEKVASNNEKFRKTFEKYKEQIKKEKEYLSSSSFSTSTSGYYIVNTTNLMA